MTSSPLNKSQDIRIVLIAFLMCLGVWMQARVPIKHPDYYSHTYIAPAFFGPNAFPVPDVSDGRIDALGAELAGDFYNGFIVPGAQDKTFDVFAKVHVPLLKGRIGIGLWMPVHEWWKYDASVSEARAIIASDGDTHDSGDLYVSTNIKVLEEKGWIPSLLLRAVLKTASGNTFSQARYFDAPGYYFDVTVANSLHFNGFFSELRGAACGGILCWQTDVGRQNDALQYGVLIEAFSEFFKLQFQFAGYCGWEKNGDRPMTVRTRIDFIPERMVSPFFQYQRGLKDWPFDQYRLGLRLNLPGKGNSIFSTGNRKSDI